MLLLLSWLVSALKWVHPSRRLSGLILEETSGHCCGFPAPHALAGSKLLHRRRGEMGKGNYFVINFLIAEHPDVAKALCSKMGLSALSADALFPHHVGLFFLSGQL